MGASACVHGWGHVCGGWGMSPLAREVSGWHLGAYVVCETHRGHGGSVQGPGWMMVWVRTHDIMWMHDVGMDWLGAGVTCDCE